MTLLLFIEIMGQKVHPLGFRIGITKKHQSQWFARFHKNNYAQSILEDKILRNTIIKLFPDLFNPVLKKLQNRQQDKKVTPKITQIKIERGLIPYEIGIQIHAQNCELLKSAIDKFKIDRDLTCYLQKAQKFLIHLGEKAKLDLEKLTVNWQLKEIQRNLSHSTNQESQKFKKKILKRVKIRGFSPKQEVVLDLPRQFSKNISRKKKNYALKARFKRAPMGAPRLTKQQYKRKKLIQKRLFRRQKVRFRFSQFIAKGLLIGKKKFNSFSLQQEKKTIFIERKIQSKKLKTLQIKSKFKKTIQSAKKRKEINQKIENKNLKKPIIGSTENPSKLTGTKIKLENNFVKDNFASNTLWMPGLGPTLKAGPSLEKSPRLEVTQKGKKKKNAVFIRIKKRIQKKFLNLYLNKMNKKFLKEFKIMIKNLSESPQVNAISSQWSGNPFLTIESNKIKSLPFGYRVNWDFQKFKSLKKQPIPKLVKLVQILEKKINKKMETLKKYFITFGTLSKIQVYSFSQILTFLKSLKTLLRQRFVRFRLGLDSMDNKFEKISFQRIGTNKKKELLSVNLSNLNSKTSITPFNQRIINTKKILIKIVKNLKNESRKIKFIEYLKQIVKKHRTKNIFYYLSTLSNASKDFKKIKKFTVKYAPFLFGLDLQNSINSDNLGVIKHRINKVLEESNQNAFYGNQDLKQALRDSLLTQIEKQKQISKENLQLTPKISIKFYSVKKQSVEIKASTVADSIVDSLEKRKAFRKVIKDAKEDLMQKQKVKGVKIQVAGRLNGAEIARTEWVRAGRVPLQTLRANIDFSYKTANTIYGIIGVKVWIFKGYIKTI